MHWKGVGYQNLWAKKSLRQQGRGHMKKKKKTKKQFNKVSACEQEIGSGKGVYVNSQPGTAMTGLDPGGVALSAAPSSLAPFQCRWCS